MRTRKQILDTVLIPMEKYQVTNDVSQKEVIPFYQAHAILEVLLDIRDMINKQDL